MNDSLTAVSMPTLPGVTPPDRAHGAGDGALRPADLAEWAQVAAGGDPDLFRERLAWEGLAEGDAHLAASVAGATWPEVLRLALERADANPLDETKLEGEAALHALAAPFLTLGTERIAEAAAQHLSKAAFTDLQARLAETLRNLFRQADAALRSVERVVHPRGLPRHSPGRLRRLVHRFPVAGRLAARAVERWAFDNGHLLTDLAADAVDLARTFNGGQVSRVARIQTGLSDPHGGGRRVKVLEFTSGCRVVYKPRAVGVELAFQELIVWLNAAGLSRPLRPLTMLVRPNHAWVEYVKHDGVSQAGDYGDVYHRAGALLCLAYVLKGTDFHHENVLVSDGHPVLVDLEMLMQPDLAGEASTAARSVVSAQLDASVLETNLVPNYHVNARGILTGGGGLAWGLAPGDTLDRPDSEAPPTIGETSLRAHLGDVLAGFTEAYRIVSARRNELTGTDGPMRAFRGQLVRFIFRPTSVYGRLLLRATQANRLLNEQARRLALEPLFLSPVRDGRRELIPVLRAERDALDDMDIPVFYVRTDATSLEVGDETIEGLFARPSYDAVLERVASLSEDDLAWQVHLIEASVGTPAVPQPTLKAAARLTRRTAPAIEAASEFESVAFDLADDLIRQAVRGAEGGLCWVARVRTGRDRYRVQPIPNTLFDGSAGIALFLAACGALGHDRARGAAMGALQPIREALLRSGAGERFRFVPGAAAGMPSLVYAFTHVARLLEQPALIDDALRATARVRLETAQGKNDVYDGEAGLILGLSGLFEATGDAHTRSLMVGASERLLAAREVTSVDGLQAWRTLRDEFYTGFAHGASGIATSLLRLHGFAPNAALADAAREAFAYERALFDPARGDWLDLPDEPEDSGRPLRAWCHGAAGIGLSRLDAIRRAPTGLPAADLAADVERALSVVDPDEIGPGDHVCCGLFGRVELLQEAERGRASEAGRAATLAASALDRRRERGSFALGAGEGLSPGFFQGVSGIGYALLRLAHPGRFPNVLTWE